jgi:predicted phosphoribosyltransferase
MNESRIKTNQEKTMNYEKPTAFRIWLQQVWAEHQEEILEVTGKKCEYRMEDYVSKYKWWLKTVYQKGRENV